MIQQKQMKDTYTLREALDMVLGAELRGTPEQLQRAKEILRETQNRLQNANP